jgi:hypothetical protein
VRQRPWRRHIPHPAIDARGFEQADDDGKTPLAIDFAEHDHLLLMDLIDDDPFQFHLHRHGGLDFRCNR